MNEMGIEYGVADMKPNEMRIAEISSHEYWINYELEGEPDEQELSEWNTNEIGK